MRGQLKHRAGRQGFVLAGILVLIVLGSMLAVSVLFRLQAEETAGSAGAEGEQAWSAAMSGVARAIGVIEGSVPGSMDWQDNPGVFKDQLAWDDGEEKWYFSVYSLGESGAAPRFGVSDENRRLNLQTATEEMLMKLPGMTLYLAHGLLDFLDRDNVPHPEGAEQEYYDALARPYRAMNGPFSSTEELLLVRGFTTSLLYGEDANLNCRLDSNEDDGADRFPADDKDGKLNPGLREYVTVHSYDLNEDNDGVPRMDVNNPNETFLMKELPPTIAAYIAGLRNSGLKIGHVADLLEARAKLKDAKGKQVDMASGVTAAELPVVLNQLTATPEYFLPGLINVNTASAAILQTLPGIDEAMADAIVSARPHLRLEQRRTTAWLVQEDIVTPEQFRKIAPRLAARSYQYHFHVVGYSLPSGRYRVLEAIVDFGRGKPMVTYLRDITRFGMPFKIDPMAEVTNA
jgi:DNA uptake protein ComE-like DNA-binding protein